MDLFHLLNRPGFEDLRASVIAQIKAREAEISGEEQVAKERARRIEYAKQTVRDPRNCYDAIRYAFALHRYAQQLEPCQTYMDTHQIMHLVIDYGGPSYSPLTIYAALLGHSGAFSEKWERTRKFWSLLEGQDPLSDITHAGT